MHNIHLYTSSRFPKSFSLRRKVVPWWYQILDPGSNFVSKWNRVFVFTCMTALFIDPLYFFVPTIGGPGCTKTDIGLGVFVTFFRTVVDLFSLMHMIMKFRTAFVAPTSRVLGKGELVRDPKTIAIRYLKSDFVVDFAAMLPLPQIVIWFVIPAVKNPTANNANHTLSLIVLIQFVPRLYVIFPLNRRIIKTSGVSASNAWSGAVYNLLLYMLASHVLGASWYLVSIQRQYECWSIECMKEMNTMHSQSCKRLFLDCTSLNDPEREAWLKVTHVLNNCDARNDQNFQFGMFADAFTNDVASSAFIEKYFYCLWWGLKSLSSYGQDIVASTYSGEILFSIFICIGGLVMFSHLIGNMQTYLQSTTLRLEEWRIRRRDTEEWMRHRQLPLELQQRVRHFVQYKWLATRGVDEESILKSLPLDTRRQIQRHLCLALVRRVPFFAQMDAQLLDAICQRLVSSLNTKSTYIVREGDPVTAMLFIIRGKLESSTTNGGQTGFFNSITLGPGDFCGEELLTWALMPTPSANLPLSTRTVRSLTEVEAFQLKAEDLTFVAHQFKRLHSKKLQHAFRYYSHQWRTWGACYIRAAWKRYAKRKIEMELARLEERTYYMKHNTDHYSNSMLANDANSGPHLGATILASKFAANTRKGHVNSEKQPTEADNLKIFKPQDPDFS